MSCFCNDLDVCIRGRRGFSRLSVREGIVAGCDGGLGSNWPAAALALG